MLTAKRTEIIAHDLVVDIKEVRKAIAKIAHAISAAKQLDVANNPVLASSFGSVAARLLKHKDTFSGKLKSARTMITANSFFCGVTLSHAPEEFCAALHSAITIGFALKNPALSKAAGQIIEMFNLSNPVVTSKEKEVYREFDLKLNQALEEQFPRYAQLSKRRHSM